MKRPLVGTLSLACALSLPAQEQPFDLPAVLAAMRPAGELPELATRVPADLRRWAGQVAASMTPAERDALCERRFGMDAADRALAIALLDRDDAEARDRVLPRLAACLWLNSVQTRANFMAGLGDDGLHWARDIAAPARQHAQALAAATLQADCRDRTALRLLCRYSADLVPEEQRAVMIDWALQQLGDEAEAIDLVAAVSVQLRRREVARAKQLIARARDARMPRLATSRDAMLRTLDAFERQADLAAALIAEPSDDPVHELKLRCAIDDPDVLATCRRLIDEGCEHALPFTLLASQHFGAGRPEAARELLAKAVDLPGANSATGMLQLFANRDRLIAAADEASPAAALQRAAMLARIDALFEVEPNPTTDLLLAIRNVGWPDCDQRRLQSMLAESFERDQTVPASSHGYYLALAGIAAANDDRVGGTFLARPLPAQLEQLPMLARLRARVATLVALRDPRAANATSAAARIDACERHGDHAEAVYLRATRAWQRAKDDDDRRAVLAMLWQRQPLAVDTGAFPHAAAIATLSAMLDGDYDHEELVRVRTLSGSGNDADNLVPLACGLLAGKAVGRGLQLAGFLRDKVTRPESRLALLRAQAGAMHAHGEADRAAAFAGQALRSDAWHDGVDLGAQGFTTTGSIHWGMDWSRSGFRFRVQAACSLFLMPKLPPRAELRRIADGR